MTPITYPSNPQESDAARRERERLAAEAAWFVQYEQRTARSQHRADARANP